MIPIVIATALIALAVGFFVRPLILKPKRCPPSPPCPPPTPCPPTGPDNIDTYRLVAQLRDSGVPGASFLTEDYSTKYPAEFVTKKVVVQIGIAGYIYVIEDR